MSIEALLIWLAVGGIAGCLAGVVVEGYGFGVVGNVVVGILGAVIAGALLPMSRFFGGGLGGQILSATIGAIILLFVLGLIKRAR